MAPVVARGFPMAMNPIIYSEKVVRRFLKFARWSRSCVAFMRRALLHLTFISRDNCFTQCIRLNAELVKSADVVGPQVELPFPDVAAMLAS